MATVQKTAKINFYKFVQVKEPSSSAVKSGGSAEIAKSINQSTVAINNLGATVNSLAAIVGDIKKVAIVQLEQDIKSRKKFKAEYTKPQTKSFGGFLDSLASGKAPGFLEGLMNLLGGLFKVAVVVPALKWIGNPANREKVKNIISAIVSVVKFIAGWAKFGIVNTIEGLYDLLKDDATPMERFGGLVRGLVGLGALLLGIRWLKNPLRIVTDFGNVLKFFYNNLVKGQKRLRSRGLARFGKVALAAGAVWLVTEGVMTRSAGDGTVDGQRDKSGKLPGEPGYDINTQGQYKPPQKAQGGKLPHKSSGGWISGPQSGYPVSLDGGRSTSFIGHGTEYVARKADGGAFVVPFNTPATSRQPNLTTKRIGEAKNLGYQLPGFAAGGNLNKQIYLHWTAGSYNHKAGPYHATVQGDGKIYRHRKYNQHTAHTYNRNSGNVGLSAATMGGTPWVSYPPKQIQIENMMKEAASVATKWGWKPGDVNIKRVMTHAEAGSNKDGRNMHDNYGPVPWGGTGERWDWWHLKKNEKPGTGGDKLRQMMKKYMGDPNAMIVPEAGGLSAADAQSGGGAQMTNIPLSISGQAKDLVGGDGDFLREVYRVSDGLKIHPADLLGLMASESGLDPKAQNKSGATGLIQFMPATAAELGTSTNALKGMTRAQQMPYVEKFLKKTLKGVPLQNGKVAAGNLYTAVYLPAFAAKDPSYVVAKKGGFSDDYGNHPAAWYTHNKGLDLNNDGAITIAELGKRIAEKKKEFGIRGGTMTIPGSSIATVSPSDHGEGQSTSAPPAAPTTSSFLGGFTSTANQFTEDIVGGRATGSQASTSSRRRRQNGVLSSESSVSGGPSPSRGGSSNIGGPSSTRESENLKAITEERNRARTAINEKTREMINAALEAVGQQNGVNAQMVAAAQQQIQQITAQNKPQQPQFIPTGGVSGAGVGRAIGGDVGAAIGGTTAAVLNSFNNPLKGIFR